MSDTTETTANAAPEPPPLKPWHKKVLIGCGVGFAALILLATCAPDPVKDDAQSAASTTETTETATPETVTETPEAAPEPPKPPHDATVVVIPRPEGDQIAVKFPISDNFTHGMIVSGAQGDTVDLLKWVKETYPNAASVLIEGTAPLKDEYGNTENRTALSLVYNADTLAKINPDGVDRKKIWSLRDAGFVSPALNP